MWAFLGAQTFNICVTFLIAWLMFGVVKPAVWPTEAKAAEPKIEAVAPEANPLTIPTEAAATQTDVEVVEYEKVENQDAPKADEAQK